jgi:predicted MFS family arabinose efflux permease
MRLAMGCTAGASAGIALTAGSLPTLVAWMMLGGCAFSLGQAGANRLLIRSVRTRQGLAFGLKQAAAPAASGLAGLSVPIATLTLGWRWAFGLVAVFAVAIFAFSGASETSPTTRASRAHRVPPLERRAALLVLAIAFAFATAASASVLAFYVDSAVGAGTPPRLAGAILAVGSLLTIIVRLLLGVLSDRLERGHLRLCAGLLAFGAFGYVLLATGRPGPMALGAIMAMAGAWGMNGVFWFAVVRAYSDQPGALTGALLPGTLLGGAVGPMALGFLGDAFGYSASWWSGAFLAMSAATVMLLGSRGLESREV